MSGHLQSACANPLKIFSLKQFDAIWKIFLLIFQTLYTSSSAYALDSLQTFLQRHAISVFRNSLGDSRICPPSPNLCMESTLHIFVSEISKKFYGFWSKNLVKYTFKEILSTIIQQLGGLLHRFCLSVCLSVYPSIHKQTLAFCIYMLRLDLKFCENVKGKDRFF